MDSIVLFRIAERLTLTTVIILVALVVMVSFWKTVQKINISHGDSLGLAGSVAFSTPIFVLLAIIGYAWVSLEHPIQVGPLNQPLTPTATAQQSGPVPAGSFIGSTQTFADGDDADVAYEAALTQRRLRSLNCVLADRDLGQRTLDDVAAVKLQLIQTLWQESWGNPAAFADWVSGQSGDSPDPQALAIWEEVHPLC